MIQVSDQKFVNFQPKMEASSCYLEVDRQFLFLQQGKGRTDEGKWGVPAGKLEKGETPEMAARRELFEETGIMLASCSQIAHVGTLYIRRPDFDYTYYMFKIPFDAKPVVRISVEHSGYQWVTVEEVKKLPLRPGAMEALQYHKARVFLEPRVL